jgi:hypothetical protein
MTSLTRLRSIRFALGAEHGVNRSRWVTQILSHMSSARLENVVFKLRFSRSGGVNSDEILDEISNALEWHDVDAVLQRTAFSRLRSVHFRSNIPFPVGPTSDRPQSSGSSARMSIQQYLPQCHVRGILRFGQC